jgi:YfiH family protein
VARAPAQLDLIRPDWPVPASVRAFATTRSGGCSRGVYASLNLGDHVADGRTPVLSNRARLRAELGLPGEPLWLQQVHGIEVVNAATAGMRPVADAAYAMAPGLVCAVLTADCLPVLLCDRAGTRVAAIHAGWRGLAAGVIEAGVAALLGSGVAGGDLLAWLGPAIGPQAYEVGAEVRSAVLAADPQAEAVFRAGRPGHWWLDLYAAARIRLARVGVTAVWGGTCCTYSDPQHFFSYRRESRTGRQASLIWLA